MISKYNKYLINKHANKVLSKYIALSIKIDETLYGQII